MGIVYSPPPGSACTRASGLARWASSAGKSGRSAALTSAQQDAAGGLGVERPDKSKGIGRTSDARCSRAKNSPPADRTTYNAFAHRDNSAVRRISSWIHHRRPDEAARVPDQLYYSLHPVRAKTRVSKPRYGFRRCIRDLLRWIRAPGPRTDSGDSLRSSGVREARALKREWSAPQAPARIRCKTRAFQSSRQNIPLEAGAALRSANPISTPMKRSRVIRRTGTHLPDRPRLRVVYLRGLRRPQPFADPAHPLR